MSAELTQEMNAERRAFGRSLKTLREKRGVSQLELSLEIYYSQRVIVGIEIGEYYPTVDMYTRMGNVLEYFAALPYRPIAAGAKLIPITDVVVSAVKNRLKSESYLSIMHACGIRPGHLCQIRHRSIGTVTRKTLQRIFSYFDWGEISDEKMGEYLPQP